MDHQNPSKFDMFEDQQVEKKLTKDSKPDTENQVEEKERCFIEELPPEMLMKVLKTLDTLDLLNFRLVNKKWNEVARDILKSRDDSKVVFDCIVYRGTGNISILWKSGKATLKNFFDCFGDSKETPLYTRFRFKSFEKAVFYYPNWIQFISDFRETISCLKLGVKYCDISDLTQFGEELRHLLLNQLPNLQEFGIDFGQINWWSDINILAASSKIVQVFPTTSTKSTAVQVQLPHLKVLHLDHSSFSKYTRIVNDLLGASVNLRKIEPFYPSSRSCILTIENLELIQTQGKLHCIQDTFIGLNDQLLSKLQQKSFAPLNLKLKTLELDISTKFENPRDKSTASQFLSTIFDSSKTTLTDFKMKPLGILTDLKFPKFNKLISLLVFKLGGLKIQAFPSGINLLETFPILQCLDLQVPWTDFFPHDEPLSCFPNLKSLLIIADGMTEKAIARISLVCPNLQKFVITEGDLGPLDNFPEVGTAIWTHMKELHSLGMDIDLDTKENTFPHVDSCFTGFSQEDCIRLYDLIQVEKLTETWSSQVKVPPSELEADGKNPSILDLKRLKKLRVCFIANSDSASYNNKMLSVSENYAFKLMDSLTYEIYQYEV